MVRRARLLPFFHAALVGNGMAAPTGVPLPQLQQDKYAAGLFDCCAQPGGCKRCACPAPPAAAPQWRGAPTPLHPARVRGTRLHARLLRARLLRAYMPWPRWPAVRKHAALAAPTVCAPCAVAAMQESRFASHAAS
jgi:hypothetical protein